MLPGLENVLLDILVLTNMNFSTTSFSIKFVGLRMLVNLCSSLHQCPRKLVYFISLVALELCHGTTIVVMTRFIEIFVMLENIHEYALLKRMCLELLLMSYKYQIESNFVLICEPNTNFVVSFPLFLC